MASFCLSFLLFLTVQHFANAEKCLSGPYHKNSSSAGDQNFVECLSYKKDACCTSVLTQTVKNHPEKLYNFTWHHCNTISSKCLRYLKNQECFYQCEPSLIRYKRTGRSDAVQNVPICSNYCDKWFDACKDESTCVTNWETGFVIVGKQYQCPSSSKCRKFKDVYKNASGLCSKMWGVSFSYHTGSGKCYTMGPHTNLVAAGFRTEPMPLSIFITILHTGILVFLWFWI